ncbi:MAG TPA: Gfo/Idh/MocA family oxidoreductase [Clostridia bacterium]|nr:Gfo/Idh/MocA family oxidoreductase [Clostridia bacterium]
MQQPVRMICLGAGSRGMDAYAPYALLCPDKLRFVAVADPVEEKRGAFAARYHVPEEFIFSDWREALASGVEAEAALVATQDNHHVEPAVTAMERGLDVLLEKPVAKTAAELARILDASERTGRSAVVCHVLRYTRFFNGIKAVIDGGEIGEVQAVSHCENIGFWHMAHSYVRGNWRREDETSPMILAKSCHDTDILLYLMGKDCRRVASFGSLKHFRAENAPEGSAARCLDCAVPDCPYNAARIYMIPGYTGWPINVVTSDFSPEGRMRALREGPYGRCVYRCDNDVVDHQSTILEFDGGASATMTVSAFTDFRHGRTIHVMGSHGEIRAKMSDETIEVTDFRTGSVRTTENPPIGGMADGHAGGDLALIDAFVRMEAGEENAVRSSIRESIQSHLICFAAEESRKNGVVVTL